MKLLLLIFLLLFIFIFIKLNNSELELKELKVLYGPNKFSSNKIIQIKFNNNSYFSIKNFNSKLINILKNLDYYPKINKIINNNLIISYDYKEIIEKISYDLINNENANSKINFYKENYQIKYDLNTKYIINFCSNNNISYFELTDNSNIYQIGYGHKRKLINNLMCTTKTLSIPEYYAYNKLLTKKLLKIFDIPYAHGYLIENKNDLEKYSKHLKYPLVLKPYNHNKGTNIICNINSYDDLSKSYDIISKNTDDIILEEYIEGNDYRLLFVNNKFVACNIRYPIYLTGNGFHTIKELIDIINLDQKRNNDILSKIRIDESMLFYLEKKNLNLESVLNLNQKIKLRDDINLSSGSISENITTIVNELTISILEDFMFHVNIDICGVDIRCEDISINLNEQKFAIIEINSGPGVRMHINPTIGKSVNVMKPIITNLLDDNNSRIPIIAVTGVNGKTTVVNIIDFILQSKYKIVGKSSSNGIFINNKPIININNYIGFNGSRILLKNKNIDCSVFEIGRGGIKNKGLGYDMADVGIITNIGAGDHIGQNYDNDSIDDLIDLKIVVIKNVLPNGKIILNANEKHIFKILKYLNQLELNKIIWFSIDLNKSKIKNLKNYPVVYFENNHIFYTYKNYKYIFNSKKIPFLKESFYLDFQIENIMTAIAALIGINIDCEIIYKQLLLFYNNIITNNGRFNIYDYKNSKIIIDYAHNIDSIKNICKIANLNQFSDHNKIILFGAAGDRQIDIINEMGYILNNCFDNIILFTSDELKHKLSTESIFKAMTKNVDKSTIQIFGEKESIDYIIDNIDDEKNLIILLIDQVLTLSSYIKNKLI